MKISYLFNAIFLLIGFCLSGQSNILNASAPEQIGIKNIDQVQSDLDSYLEYEFIDDRDILWSKIVYEKIDLSERLNFPLLFPIDDDLYENTRKSLWRVLKENILNGNITKIYSDVNDNFRYPLAPDEVKDIVATKIDFGDGELIPKEVGSDDITGYRIKGMWYFDKRRGELMYRLLGLMPVGEDLKNIDGDEEKKTNLFWIWYPSIREILHNELVFNDTSNANRISFDQLLLSRRFSSYIYKEDNLYGDRAISAYKNKGLESILESARIKKEILDFEQDLWNR
ncbi:MAG: gliding motility protein GldN [Flavobacteriaceae bacterium]|nr:gliding motility protein GldN [Flavobacteriaceae bacterium]MDG1830463.1 gliding motility protein GldN [Flavobacteriaceae bacterium]